MACVTGRRRRAGSLEDEALAQRRARRPPLQFAPPRKTQLFIAAPRRRPGRVTSVKRARVKGRAG
jgi:hypothetical protein